MRASAHTSLEMSATKRKSQQEEEEEWEGVREKRRRVEFTDVTIYSFKRRQGFVCVPSQVRLRPRWPPPPLAKSVFEQFKS